MSLYTEVLTPEGNVVRCDLLVLCVPCPICKRPAGVPCKGTTDRRTFVSYTHYPRRLLWQIYKKGEFETPPANKLDEIRIDRLVQKYGDFVRTFRKPDPQVVIEAAMALARMKIVDLGIPAPIQLFAGFKK